ncbi:MAG: succinoglycan biosynthesis transport protein ExoP [Sediminicola sp.]|jgi:succinoglycan biosynthesis transport protein ExoP
MDLVKIFKVLFNRKWWLIGAFVIATVTAFVLTADIKKTYRSTAHLATNFTISQEVQVSQERFNLYEADVKFNNLIENMSSARVITLLSYNLLIHDLQNPSDAFRNIDDQVNEDPELAEIDKENMMIIAQSKLDSMSIINTYIETDQRLKTLLEAYEYSFDDINDQLQISRIKNTDFVSINAYTENPFLSSFMANKLCSEFLRYNSSSISDRSNISVDIFGKLVSQKKEELDSKIEKLRQFKSNNSLLNLSAESESKISILAELDNDLEVEQRKLRSVTLQLEDVISQIKNAGGTISGSNIDIVDLRKKISSLNQRYIEEGATNKILLDSLNLLRNRQSKLISTASRKSFDSDDLDAYNQKKNDLEIDKVITQGNIDAIKANIVRLRINVGGYASKEAQISTLEREVNLASEDYKNAQEKYNKSLDLALASGNSINQILEGQPADEAEPSKRLIISGLSGISTLILTLLVIILLEYVDVSIQSISNFKETMDIELIGTLNQLDLKKQKLVKIFHPSIKPNKKNDAFKESLRKLRYTIEKQKKKIYLITSLKPSEGKTTVIKAISLAFSQSNSKILMIDANFSNNELSNQFKTNSTLERILNPTDSKMSITISNSKMNNNIDIIGCEGGDYTPIEIFNQKRLSSMLESLRERYDYIFIEGACLNLYSDSRELSDFIDGVITVFSATSILKEVDFDSLKFLKELGNKNSGAILNNLELDNYDT